MFSHAVHLHDRVRDPRACKQRWAVANDQRCISCNRRKLERVIVDPEAGWLPISGASLHFKSCPAGSPESRARPTDWCFRSGRSEPSASLRMPPRPRKGSPQRIRSGHSWRRVCAPNPVKYVLKCRQDYRTPGNDNSIRSITRKARERPSNPV